MKKQTKIIIWSVAIILLIVGCVLVFKIVTGKKSDKNSTLNLFECMSSDIVSYSVDDGHGNYYKIVRENDIWKVENNDVTVIDSEKAEELIRCASRITATGVATKEQMQAKNDSVTTVKIGLSAGSEYTVTFFGESANMCLMMVNGDKKVYTQHASIRDILAQPLDKLIIIDVFTDFDDAKKMPEIYEYTDYDKSEISIRTKNGSELAQDDKNHYIMTKPYYRSVDDEKLVQEIIIKLPAITRKGGYVDNNPENYAIYGLDAENRAELRLVRENKEKVLYLGKNENGMTYAAMKDEDGVFVIKSSQLEFLHTEPFYLIDSRLFERKIESINKIAVIVGGTEYTLKRNKLADGSEWFSKNGKNARKEEFEEISQMLNEINLASELITKPENTGKITVKIYSDKDGTFVIDLAEAGEKEYAVFVKGTANFAVEKLQVDEIIAKVTK